MRVRASAPHRARRRSPRARARRASQSSSAACSVRAISGTATQRARSRDTTTSSPSRVPLSSVASFIVRAVAARRAARYFASARSRRGDLPSPSRPRAARRAADRLPPSAFARRAASARFGERRHGVGRRLLPRRPLREAAARTPRRSASSVARFAAGGEVAAQRLPRDGERARQVQIVVDLVREALDQRRVGGCRRRRRAARRRRGASGRARSPRRRAHPR